MPLFNKHIILLGFKHVGKSTVGANLAAKLEMNFQDLDSIIEYLYEDEYGKWVPCRDIMKEHGEMFFRTLENEALQRAISMSPRVLALGGGTPINKHNQELIKAHKVIHITTSKGIVFERIVMNGRPSFFSPEEDLLVTFNRLWEEREIVYRKLAKFCVYNNGAINLAVSNIIENLQTEAFAYEF
jgi:shikimate kinase